MARNKEALESGVVHFTIGDDMGLRIMEIAQEHLLYGNNPTKAIKAITDSLMGCPDDIALQILKGDLVLPVDVESQQVICQDRLPEHDRFPQIDVVEFIRLKGNDIERHGHNIIVYLTDLGREMNKTNGRFKTDFDYKSIFKFINGSDEALLEELQYDEEISQIERCIITAKKFIEEVMATKNTVAWMVKTWGADYGRKETAIINNTLTDISVMLTEITMTLKDILNNEFVYINKADVDEYDASLDSYLKAVRENDEVIKNGIEPVNIMDKYNAGWLSPDGDYYALNGEIANMLHIQIADALQEKGIIPMYANGVDDDGGLVNPDAWLEQHGWVKIHDSNIQFAGCLNTILGKKNVAMTDIQIRKIYEYGQLCCEGKLKIGWRMEFMSAVRFRDMMESQPEAVNKKYFEY